MSRAFWQTTRAPHLDTAGVLEHREFLASGRVDPRREFVATLIDALGDRSEPILVYSRFEASVLDELACVTPALVPGFGYADLEGVAGGDEAATAFLTVAQGAVSEAKEFGCRVVKSAARVPG